MTFIVWILGSVAVTSWIYTSVEVYYQYSCCTVANGFDAPQLETDTAEPAVWHEVSLTDGV